MIGDKKSNVHAYFDLIVVSFYGMCKIYIWYIRIELLLLIGDKKSNVHAYFDDDDTMTATITSGGEEIVVEVMINGVLVLAN